VYLGCSVDCVVLMVQSVHQGIGLYSVYVHQGIVLYSVYVHQGIVLYSVDGVEPRPRALGVDCRVQGMGVGRRGAAYTDGCSADCRRAALRACGQCATVLCLWSPLAGLVQLTTPNDSFVPMVPPLQAPLSASALKSSSTLPAPSVFRTCTLVWWWGGGAQQRARTCKRACCVGARVQRACHSSVCLKKLRLTKADLSLESRAMLQNAALPVKDGTNEAPWRHVHSSLPPVLPVNAAVRHGGGAQEDAFAPADMDGSGGLTFDEWKHAFGGKGKGGVKAHVLRALFDKFDADQDSSVSLAEFQAGGGELPRSLFEWVLLSAKTVLWRFVNALSAFGGLERSSSFFSGGAELHSDTERSIVDLLLLAFADFLIGLRLSGVSFWCVANVRCQLRGFFPFAKGKLKLIVHRLFASR